MKPHVALLHGFALCAMETSNDAPAAPGPADERGTNTVRPCTHHRLCISQAQLRSERSAGRATRSFALHLMGKNLLHNIACSAQMGKRAVTPVRAIRTGA